jgi:hypothetical protein
MRLAEKIAYRRTAKEDLIQRKQGDLEHGHFRPIVNILTEKGRQLLASSP